MSSATLQHTVAAPALCRGVGVHSNAPVTLAVRPAAQGAGVVFVRSDLQGAAPIALSPAAVVDTRLHTVIGNASGVTVSTVEHVLAALAAVGVDNAVVELDGPEAPIMDGSSQPFIAALDRAGLRAQGEPRRFIEVTAPVEVVDGDKRAALLPGDGGFAMDVEIAFASPAIGRQRLVLDIDEAAVRRELAPARTFGFVHEVEALRAQGLAQGAGLHNAVAIDGDRVVNPEGLRFADECVRHKMLDALGDIYVLGAPLLGRYEAVRPGHALNAALTRALLARPDAWRWRAFAPAFAAAS